MDQMKETSLLWVCWFMVLWMMRGLCAARRVGSGQLYSGAFAGVWSCGGGAGTIVIKRTSGRHQMVACLRFTWNPPINEGYS